MHNTMPSAFHSMLRCALSSQNLVSQPNEAYAASAGSLRTASGPPRCTARPFVSHRKERLLLHTVRAEKETGPEGSDTTESLFAKELEKRGMSGDNWSSQDDEPVQDSVRWRDSPSDQANDDQFEKARALGSEGLEGLIPRAKELLKLGAVFSLAFGPAIAAVSGFAVALYLLFGDSLVHGGRPGLEPPQYIDPYELLEAESKIPMVPFNKKVDPAPEQAQGTSSRGTVEPPPVGGEN